MYNLGKKGFLKMAERKLSDRAILEMDITYKNPFQLGRENRRKDDRRKAINSCVDPYFERRSGKDRRNEKI